MNEVEGEGKRGGKVNLGDGWEIGFDGRLGGLVEEADVDFFTTFLFSVEFF